MASKLMLILALLTAIGFAQSKSAVQFYDTTGNTKTGKVGWSGDATTGHFFIQTPAEGELIKSQAGGVNIIGTVTASKFTGDGSGLTNLPASAAPSVGSVAGLQDSLNKKADTTWVLGKTGQIADGSLTTAKIADKAVTDAKIDSVSFGKIKGLPSFALTTNPTFDSLNLRTLISSGNVGIGTTAPIDRLTIIEGALRIGRGGDQNGYRFFTESGGERMRIQYRYADWSGTSQLLDSDIMTFFWAGGLVGLGTGSNPLTEKLEVCGNIKASGSITGNQTCSSSDRRFKTDITPIDSSLSKVSKLQGVFYNWDRKKWPQKNFPEGKQVGLIAQEVEKVIPEVVNTDKEGYKSLSYDKLTAVLIEAVKEQQKRIESQQVMILTLKKELQELQMSAKK
jgi:hypothetical protein